MNIILLLCCLWVYSELSSVSTALRNEVCYGVYGCFALGYPFDNQPHSPEHLKVKILLNTRKTGDTPIVLENLPGAKSVKGFDLKKRIKVLIPGFKSGSKDPKELRRAILSREDCNVLVINWHEPRLITFNLLLYLQAVANARVIGAVVGEFLFRLKVSRCYDMNRVHIYGHSLGAHIAGYVGQYCNKKKHMKMIGTITGLDPAGPSFEGLPPLARLDPSDAQLVLAVHTDAGSILTLPLGIKQRVGHVDLYVNGGSAQPCSLLFKNKNSTFKNSHAPETRIGCSHSVVVEYAVEWISRTQCRWVPRRCPSWKMYQRGRCRRGSPLALGLDYSKPLNGTYYYKTRPKYPYCNPYPPRIT